MSEIEFSKEYFEQSFTSVEDAKRFVLELESLNLSECSDETMEAIVNKCFQWIPSNSAFIRSGEKLFRARINKDGRSFAKVSDLYVRESEKINDYGRAHRPHERVFYCASNYPIAVFEVLQELKSNPFSNKNYAIVTIGVWEVLKELNISNIIHSKRVHEFRADINAEFLRKMELFNHGNFNSETIESSRIISEFFANQFSKSNIKNSHEYKISALYASILHRCNSIIADQYADDRVDGINYPSVALNYKGDNQALFIETADRRLKLVEAFKIYCRDINFDLNEFQYAVIEKAAKIEAERIPWHIYTSGPVYQYP